MELKKDIDNKKTNKYKEGDIVFLINENCVGIVFYHYHLEYRIDTNDRIYDLVPEENIRNASISEKFIFENTICAEGLKIFIKAINMRREKLFIHDYLDESSKEKDIKIKNFIDANKPKEQETIFKNVDDVKNKNQKEIIKDRTIIPYEQFIPESNFTKYITKPYDYGSICFANGLFLAVDSLGKLEIVKDELLYPQKYYQGYKLVDSDLKGIGGFQYESGYTYILNDIFSNPHSAFLFNRNIEDIDVCEFEWNHIKKCKILHVSVCKEDQVFSNKKYSDMEILSTDKIHIGKEVSTEELKTFFYSHFNSFNNYKYHAMCALITKLGLDIEDIRANSHRKVLTHHTKSPTSQK